LRTIIPYLLSFFFPAIFIFESEPAREAQKLSAALLPLQPKEEELIDWDASRPLSWSDYKGRPDPESDAAASTTTYLAIEYKMRGADFTYKVHSRFSCDKSWGLHKTEYILSHEQGHFDIAEIYARVLHKKMSEYRFDKDSYKKDLKKIYEDVVKAKEDMQERYDKETNHSIYRAKQAEWLETIALMLEKTEPYSDY
jgi:hypothetical protein